MPQVHPQVSLTTADDSFSVVHTEEEGKLIIEGKYLPSDRVDRLVRIADTEDPDACYLTRLNLDLKHTVMIIPIPALNNFNPQSSTLQLSAYISESSPSSDNESLLIIPRRMC